MWAKISFLSHIDALSPYIFMQLYNKNEVIGRFYRRNEDI